MEEEGWDRIMAENFSTGDGAAGGRAGGRQGGGEGAVTDWSGYL